MEEKYKLEDFRKWLEADPSRKNYASSYNQSWGEWAFDLLREKDNWARVLRNEHPTFAYRQKQTIFQWKAEVDKNQN